MRRWNGWGNEKIDYPLPESALTYLTEHIGAGSPAPDATFVQAVRHVPVARLPEHPLITSDPGERLLHARGQSLPDWAALRSGRVGAFPDGVAYPQDAAQVQQLLHFATSCEAAVIPYGGGTSVVGHINPLPGERPTLTVDLSRMNALLDLDETSRLATFGAGVRGPDLESQLAAHGYTLGHFPQSFELSTLGGWIAARSTGQQSYYYGRIEDLFAGGHLETPCGPLHLPALPASAAGPDLRQLLLGSEGRTGILTQATVRIRPRPGFEAFYGVFFHEWEEAVDALRSLAQAGTRVSMARLSNAQETETTLTLSGKERLVSLADRGLRLAGFDARRCLLIFGVTCEPSEKNAIRHQALAHCRQKGGLFTGTAVGKLWRKSRFLTPYLRNTLWEHGYAVDTIETALPWKGVTAAAAEIQSALHAAIQAVNERALVFAHLSHIYPDGASIYTTLIFRRSTDPDETLERWTAMKTAACRAIVACGGTISHQHGVGRDHIPYLEAEKGRLGIELIRKAIQTLDPRGLMNPGKLLPD